MPGHVGAKSFKSSRDGTGSCGNRRRVSKTHQFNLIVLINLNQLNVFNDSNVTLEWRHGNIVYFKLCDRFVRSLIEIFREKTITNIIYWFDKNRYLILFEFVTLSSSCLLMYNSSPTTRSNDLHVWTIIDLIVLAFVPVIISGPELIELAIWYSLRFHFLNDNVNCSLILFISCWNLIPDYQTTHNYPEQPITSSDLFPEQWWKWPVHKQIRQFGILRIV